MLGTIGNIAGGLLGGPLGSLAGGAIGSALDGGSGGGEAKAFEQALGQFATQVAGDAMDEMNQAMADTEEDFA
ncbi:MULTISPECIES: hypothetical protein [Methylobacterium]|uniref:Uncharacterized protein n=1 Tax=Methylobacterium jeotgali TaxID=381630 RepID=A0ABQ4SYD3_9HYPH|nr:MULTISPECIES: hypothetical protein [Methylobacterium]PIU07278.1 MAG: hypothetical protein COT56_05445 [Methylobacterium sp. CG09_land_8_20_14_0_10_71_15]GJE06789.1 hypothetical protein AOPFMNJM_2111 [Methylobacterium jeotgali]